MPPGGQKFELLKAWGKSDHEPKEKRKRKRKRKKRKRERKKGKKKREMEKNSNRNASQIFACPALRAKKLVSRDAPLGKKMIGKRREAKI